MHKIGLIINPYAGLGGRAGLKGSDSAEIQQKAMEAGFHSCASERVSAALERLLCIKDSVEVLTYSHEMGEDVVCELGFQTTVIGVLHGKSTALDTIKAARLMRDAEVELIIFAGGDGTARDIYAAVQDQIPVLGIPCGVKMHSAVYAINPRRAGEIAKNYLMSSARNITYGEVMDIDEVAFRQGKVRAQLYGYLRVPDAGPLMQKVKAGSSHSEDKSLQLTAKAIVDLMEEDVLYIVGPGSTTTYIMKELGLPYTLLGVDLVVNKKLLGSDVDERRIWDALEQYKKAEIIVTVIGGQGHLFGRGNQQLSPRIIKKVGRENIRIIISDYKLADLHTAPFLVDTGDVELDKSLCGYIKIMQSKNCSTVYRIDM